MALPSFQLVSSKNQNLMHSVPISSTFQHKSRIWLISQPPTNATITVIFHKAYCRSPLTGFHFCPCPHSVCLTRPPHGLQHNHPGVCSNSCPSSRWCHPTISSSAPPSPPSFSLSQHQGLFQWVSSLHQVAKVLEFQLQHQSSQWISRTDFLQGWLVGSPCSPRGSQESSPTPLYPYEIWVHPMNSFLFTNLEVL